MIFVDYVTQFGVRNIDTHVIKPKKEKRKEEEERNERVILVTC